MGRAPKGQAGKRDPAEEAFAAGYEQAVSHPLFGALLRQCRISRARGNYCPDTGWAVVVNNGQIHLHPSRRGEPEEWAFVLAHAALHLGFEHFQPHERPAEWNAACCCLVVRFLIGMKFGRPPADLLLSPELLPASSEERLYHELCLSGIPEELRGLGVAGPHVPDLWYETRRSYRDTDFGKEFEKGLGAAVDRAIQRAAGAELAPGKETAGGRARTWFLNHYPLLGALAMAFDIVEDAVVLARMQVSIGAVCPESREIFINSARLDEPACRFVMAHELLHVGLRHQARRQGRDAFLWNVACDYVINDWLIQMAIGEPPPHGLLHDPELRGLSAEAIYDRLVTDMRRYRKLATLRGVGLGDLLPSAPDFWMTREGVRLDELYRQYLSQGLLYHEEQGRGLLPAGLVEEIRALSHPPIPWDVELARWFDHWFAPLEKVRSFARPSRRQSATPDIPRPRWVLSERALDARTFGVVLDTSGSMDRTVLARALGAISSYAMSRDVPAARVVFCDAQAYDQGYMPVEDIAERRVLVKGRGGTVLQPGIDLLQGAADFPPSAPLLIITDGHCDRLQVRREHAFLLPQGRSLPFVPRGEVFRIG